MKRGLTQKRQRQALGEASLPDPQSLLRAPAYPLQQAFKWARFRSRQGLGRMPGCGSSLTIVQLQQQEQQQRGVTRKWQRKKRLQQPQLQQQHQQQQQQQQRQQRWRLRMHASIAPT